MALCTKTVTDVSVAFGIILITFFAVSCTFFGTWRRFTNITDETWVTSDHLVLWGNILQSFAVLGTLYIVSKSDKPLLKGILMALSIILLVLIIYMSMFYTTPGQNPVAQAFILGFLSIDACVKIYAVLLGFGVCEMSDVPYAMSQMANTLVGGLKRRR